MQSKFLLFLVLMVIGHSLHAQGLSGKITDDKNAAIPWATVFIKELMFGTVANQEGEFEIKIPEGEYTAVFQSMGYQAETVALKVGAKAQSMHIVLKPMVYNLSGVVVSSDGEDPAYGIMRRVIQKAPQYAAMVRYYKADVYIRGSLEINSISRMVKWMAKDDLKEANIKEGDVYLEESVNEVEYTAPSKINQRVKSIHSNFPKTDDSKSSSAIGYISGNLYKSDAFGNAWSPFVPGAFSHYRFKLEGTEVNGNVLVYKIKIIPKGKGPKYVRGYVFIIDGLWCIYSIDVQVEEQLGVDIQLAQTFGEVKPSVWLPVSNRFKLDMDLMGNSGGFLYNTSIRYHSLNVNTAFIPKADAIPQEMKQPVSNSKVNDKVKKLSAKTEKLEAKEDLSTAEAYKLARIRNKKETIKVRDSLRNNHEFVENYKTTIDSNALRTDTAFWNNIRPIPLASNELLSVQRSDSLLLRRSSSKDSLVQKSAFRKLSSALLFGGFYDFDSVNRLSTLGFINPFGLAFNTVDGFVYSGSFEFIHKKRSRYEWKTGFKPSYGFSSGDFMWQAYSGFEGLGKYKNTFRISGGSLHSDYNPEGGPLGIENSISSLFFRQNLSRLLKQDYIKFEYSVKPFFGAGLKTLLVYAKAGQLKNQSDFSFFYRDERIYGENKPSNANYIMGNHSDLILDAEFSYRHFRYYFIKDGIKIPRRGLNRSPEYFVSFKKAFVNYPLSSDFTLLRLGLRQDYYFSSGSNLKYEAVYSKFLTRDKIFFDDFIHFNAQPLVLTGKDFFSAFQLIDYYGKSTSDGALQASVAYTSGFLMLTRLPLLRNRLWQESFSLSMLGLSADDYHLEAGYGIGNSLYKFGVFIGTNSDNDFLVGGRIAIPIFTSKQVTVGM